MTSTTKTHTGFSYRKHGNEWLVSGFGRFGREAAFVGSAVEVTTKGGETHTRTVTEIVEWRRFSSGTRVTARVRYDDGIARKAGDRFRAAVAKRQEENAERRADAARHAAEYLAECEAQSAAKSEPKARQERPASERQLAYLRRLMDDDPGEASNFGYGPLTGNFGADLSSRDASRLIDNLRNS